MNHRPFWTLLTVAAALAAAWQAAPTQQTVDRDRLADRLEHSLRGDRHLASWGLLEHGSLAVGYRRNAGVSYWYPSKSGPAMVLADYTEPDQFEAYGARVGDLLESRMYASRSAPPLAGPYPLIVVPGGYLNESLFAETAEFLASHGFVVAYLRLPLKDPDRMLAAAASAVDRIGHPAADRNRVALWGFREGGGVALLLQDRLNAAAIVSVEGSEAWTDAARGLPALAPRLASLAGTAPVLRFQSTNEAPERYVSSQANTTLEFYARYAGALEQVEIDGVNHDQLSALAIWANVAPGLVPPSPGAIEAHRLIAERGLAFIQTHTKH